MSKKEPKHDLHKKLTNRGESQSNDEYPVDAYTGEPEPLAEDAGKVVEIVPSDAGSRSGDSYLLEEESALDKVALDTQTDAIVERINRYTEDEDVEDTFQERQKLAAGGRQQLEQELSQHNAEDPDLAGGDLDADWESASSAGEESVGGAVPTPDQDVVEELGEGLGITYEDDEMLGGDKKLKERDRERWELNPESAEQ